MSQRSLLGILSVALLAVLVSTAALGQIVQVSIPDTSAQKGDTLLIPIRVSSMTTSDSVYSGHLNMMYDTGVIDILGIETAGTISAAGVSILYNTATRELGFASANIITGSGDFVYLRTRVLTNPVRDTTTIFFPDTAFNEGSPLISMTGGKLAILRMTVSPKTPPSLLVVGDSLQFSVSGDQILPLSWISSDTAVGTIDSSGKFKAKAHGQTKVYVADSQGLMDSTNLFPVYPVQAASLTVSAHDTLHTQTLLFDMPIYVSNVTSLGILAADITVNFSSTRLQAIDVVQAGSMTAGWAPAAFNIISGQIQIVLAGAEELSGSGVLVYLRMKVLPAASGPSAISFADVLFNENLTANSVPATFTPITAPTVVVTPNTAQMLREDTLSFAVTSGGTPPYTWLSTNPTVASIDPSAGILTAHLRGTTTVSVTDSFGFVGTSGTIIVNDVQVNLPDTAVWPLDSLDVPLVVDDVTGLEIYSFEIRIVHDSLAAQVLNVLNAGTISSSFNISYKDTLDTLRIAGAGTSPLSGSGTLLKIRLWGNSFPSDTSLLNFTKCVFNEPGMNTPTAETRNGSLSIVDAAAVPALNSPSASATGVSPSIMLIWHQSGFATSYRIQLSSFADFSGTLVNSSTADTSYAVSGLSHNTTYYWRVNASNAGGTSPYSASRSFTTILAAPMLSNPADGDTGIATDVTVRWHPPAGADTYRLQLSQDSTFASTLVDSPGLTDTVFAVSGLSENSVYFWRVNATNAGGTSMYSAAWRFTTTMTTSAAGGVGQIPKEYTLSQNYPNPFNPSTMIRFGVPVQSTVRLIVYDIAGNEVRMILAGVKEAGVHLVTFEGSNLSSGVYFYRLEAIPSSGEGKSPFIRTMKMILLR